MSIPMKKYSADIHGEFENNSDIGDGAVYLASEVDARIAELERLLREAHFFMGEDFQFSGHWSDIKVEDVCAAPRYLQLWKDLNKALGL